MSSRPRQRVVHRSHVVARRRKALVAVVVLGALGLLGAKAVKDQLQKGRSPWRLIPAPRIRVVAVEGLGEPAKAVVAARFADWTGRPLSEADFAAAHERLASEPLLRLEGVEKSWLLRRVTLKVVQRRPLARCEGSRRAATVLDDSGELYEAPDAPADLPSAGGCAASRSPEERRALADFLKAWQEAGPEGLVLETVRPGESSGWELDLADGTKVRWGSAEATAAKQRRLRAVLEDGHRRFGGVRSADLRFFDQGKVLVVPVR